MNICPNCLGKNNKDNYKGYCDECYDDIYLAFNEDPNNGIFGD